MTVLLISCVLYKCFLLGNEYHGMHHGKWWYCSNITETFTNLIWRHVFIISSYTLYCSFFFLLKYSILLHKKELLHPLESDLLLKGNNNAFCVFVCRPCLPIMPCLASNLTKIYQITYVTENGRLPLKICSCFLVDWPRLPSFCFERRNSSFYSCK